MQDRRTYYRRDYDRLHRRGGGRGDGSSDDSGDNRSPWIIASRSSIQEGDTIKVRRIIRMNDELAYMSSNSGWTLLNAINSFKTNYPYKVYNGIGNYNYTSAIEYGTPFEIYVLDQALSTAICALTACMAAMIALF